MMRASDFVEVLTLMPLRLFERMMPHPFTR